ncbi:MAG TPA: hypothetical protein VKR83_05770 [Ktedonobacteraceae bacterium]|nr:hypothetical protein [Ktedonobacteraceae bacterium]
MPNKYEREIEEILRHLDQSAPKARLGQRIRRKSVARVRGQKRSLPSFNFGLSEWCLIIAWVAALIAGGWAYAHQSISDPGTNIITGSIALVSVFCLLMVVVLAFLPQSRYPGQPARTGNVTPMRRNPLSSLSTRWNLFLLKLRYRRRKDH